MLYVSKNARVRRWPAGRTWLAVGYGLAAVLMLIMAVAACSAQADRIGDALASAPTYPVRCGC